MPLVVVFTMITAWYTGLKLGLMFITIQYIATYLILRFHGLEITSSTPAGPFIGLISGAIMGLASDLYLKTRTQESLLYNEKERINNLNKELYDAKDKISTENNNLETTKKDLEAKNQELKKFNEIAVDRELKMVELKKELKNWKRNHNYVAKNNLI